LRARRRDRARASLVVEPEEAAERNFYGITVRRRLRSHISLAPQEVRFPLYRKFCALRVRELC
jgi:hypothetical protein